MRTSTRTDGTEVTSYSVAETAGLVRAALKKKFPGTKFSVRSKSYSGGASITVRYIDGPTGKAVEDVAKRYAGAGFDGMIDLKYHHNHFLLPDGTVRWARSYGHSYDNAKHPYTLDDLPEGTKVVSFGADYVFVEREFSAERRAEIEGEIAAAAGAERFEMNGEYDVAVIDGAARRCTGMNHCDRWGSSIFHRLAATKDYS